MKVKHTRSKDFAGQLMDEVNRAVDGLIADAEKDATRKRAAEKQRAPGATEAREEKPQANEQKSTTKPAGATLKAHRLAKLTPDMTSGEKIGLQRDIKKHGVREPIVVYQGEILDGRHRYAACRELGLECPSVEFRGTDKEAADLVMSLNLHRRHLDQAQKRELIEAMLKVNPKASDRSIAKTAKVDHKTVGAVRRKGEATGEIPQSSSRVGMNGVAKPLTASKPLTAPTGKQIAASFRESAALDRPRRVLRREVEALTGQVTLRSSTPERSAQVLLEAWEPRDLVKFYSELGYAMHLRGMISNWIEHIRDHVNAKAPGTFSDPVAQPTGASDGQPAAV